MKKFYIMDDLTQTVLAGPFDDRQKALEAYEKAKKEFPDAHVMMVEHEPETQSTPSQEQNEKQILRKRWKNVAAGFWVAAYVEHTKKNFKKSKEYIERAKDAEHMANPMFSSIFSIPKIGEYLLKFEQFGEKNADKAPKVREFLLRNERERRDQALERQKQERIQREEERKQREIEREERYKRGLQNLPRVGDEFVMDWKWIHKDKILAFKDNWTFFVKDDDKYNRKLKGKSGTHKFKVIRVVDPTSSNDYDNHMIFARYHGYVQPID